MDGKKHPHDDALPHKPDDASAHLESARDRLYSRAQAPQRDRHDFARAAQRASVAQPSVPHTAPAAAPIPPRAQQPVMNTQPRRGSGYRAKVLVGGGLFFLIALILSSAFLFFGSNTISGNNISIEVDAPFAIGGGEELSLQIAVMNRNSVPVESATLIIEYPTGTQAADGTSRELLRERIPLDSISPGEALSVPMKSRLFGEENTEKIINISVEYRVAGSNAVFYKEATPLRIKISSSPVVISVESLEEVSSGQEVTLEVTVASNSPTPLSDVLVQATYPFGFDFSRAEPAPVSGQNTWSIATLEPDSEHTFIVEGVMTGGSAEARTFEFAVGVPSERDRFALASVLSVVTHEMNLTDPFVGLTVTMNNSSADTISVGPDESVGVSIAFENTLSNTIYDGAISVKLSGNGLNSNNIQVQRGFFNSSANTITWTSQDISGLAEMRPGARETMSFSIRGADIDAVRTPQVSFDVSVRGRRISENNVPQELTNILQRTVQFNTITSLSGHGLYSDGPFRNVGPMPPVAEQVTQYSIILTASNGSNDLTGAVVTMTLPIYVTWQNVVTSGDRITYNSESREVSWNIGDIAAGASHQAGFQISFLPSLSQVGSVPTIVNEQRLRATDRFTGAVVRATSPRINIQLARDPDSAAQEARVLAP